LHATFAGFDQPSVQFGTGCCGIGLVAGVALAHKSGEPTGKYGRGRGIFVLFHTCRNVSTALIQPGLEFRLGWSGRLCGIEVNEAAGSLV